jgi:hypothetical protein
MARKGLQKRRLRQKGLVKRDLPGSFFGRDEGMARVLRNEKYDFAGAVRKGVRKSFPPDSRISGEDIRIKLIDDNLVELPHHSNCWGAAIYSCIRAGLLKPTNAYHHMELKRSHARRTRIYKRVGAIDDGG